MNPGDRWGGFRIIRYLGSGAMGEVFLAHNELENRDVAVKRVRRPPGVEGEEKIAAERTGAELERRLSSVDQRVTRVYWYGEITGDLAVEMEYVEGRDLSAVISEGPVAPGRAAVIALELCEMLENLRVAGVVHGDLKPKNIRIDTAGRIRVMDFGVAKALAKSRDYTQALFGSIAYCSPERLESGSMDLASDLWSVGVMLYQMLSGRLPFEGATPERLERRIRSGEPPAPLPDAVPEALHSICARMLAANLSERYASPMAAHADLKLFLSGRPVPKHAFSSGDATQRTSAPDRNATIRTKAPLPKSPSLWKPLRRIAAVGLAALFAVLVLLWVMIRPQYQAWADTRDLKREIETEHVSVDDAWNRYRDIANRKRLGMAMWGINTPLEAKLVAAGDVPILDFRNNDNPTSREGTWRRSITYFSRALELHPGDKTLRGKLRLCEAHVDRITAGNRQAMLNEADAKFREAAELMHKSPDPWIGLARLYAYNLGDCERAQQALHEAEKRGHPENRREQANMADAYARRALQTLRDAGRFHEMPDAEFEALRHARVRLPAGARVICAAGFLRKCAERFGGGNPGRRICLEPDEGTEPVTTTRQSAAARAGERKRNTPPLTFRLRELLFLLVSTAVVCAGLWLVWQSKSRVFDDYQKGLAAGRIADLHQMKSQQQLLPFLTSVAGPEDRDFVARRIFAAHARQFANAGAIGNMRVTEREISAHARLETFPKRIAEAEAREAHRKPRWFGQQARAATVSLLTPEEVRSFKQSVVVRTPEEYRNRFLLWCALTILSFYAVHLFWRIRGFSGDQTMLPALHLLSGAGLILMISLRDPLRDTLMFQDFAEGLVLGVVLLAALSVVDFEREFRGLSYVWLGLSILLAIALALFGSGPGESDAKVNLGFFQPVEVIRIMLVFFLAGYFARNWDALRDLKQQRGPLRALSLPRLQYLLPVVIGVLAALAMFFLLKDLGPALVIGCLFLALYSVARNRFGLALAGLCAIVLVFWGAHAMGYPETVTQRIDMRSSPWDNHVHGGDQLAHSLWALSSGGALGSGVGLGTPEFIPAGHTDLIVAALGEEWGFVGVFGVYLLYGILLYRSLRIALRAPGAYSVFLVVGLAAVTALQILLITGGILGIIPLSGVVSPFLSYGRSSMAANFALFGIILAVSGRLHANQAPRFGRPVRILGIAVGVCFCVVMARAAQVQIVQADELAARAALVVQSSGPRQYQYNPRLTLIARQLQKGEIFDRNGLPLASSNWAALQSHAAQYASLGVPLESAPPANRRRFYPLGPKMFYLLGDVVSRRKQGASNTAFQERASRVRLQGFDDYADLEVSKDEKTGREVRRIKYDYRDLLPLLRHGNEPDNPEVKDMRERTRDVRMSIDARLQMRASAILEQHLHKLGKDKGSLVVMDPDTGDLLAAVSYPWPAPAEFTALQAEPAQDVDDAQLQDRARYGLYPPGSSFKLVTAISALRKDPGLAQQRYGCIRLPDGRTGNFVGQSKRPIRDDIQDREPHGSVDMERGIVVSCNAYFAQLGAYKVGARGLFDTAALFGIQTASPNKWEELRKALPQASYGQGQVVVSPFQMARVVSAIANGGTVMQGRWVMDDSNTRTREPVRLFPPAEAARLGRYMREVVTAGTGKMLGASPVPIAGKTGTAELAGAASHAWFVGFAPYDTAPKAKRIAFAVLVENGQYGGTASAPIAGEVVLAARDLGLITERTGEKK